MVILRPPAKTMGHFGTPFAVNGVSMVIINACAYNLHCDGVRGGASTTGLHCSAHCR